MTGFCVPFVADAAVASPKGLPHNNKPDLLCRGRGPARLLRTLASLLFEVPVQRASVRHIT